MSSSALRAALFSKIRIKIKNTFATFAQKINIHFITFFSYGIFVYFYIKKLVFEFARFFFEQSDFKKKQNDFKSPISSAEFMEKIRRFPMETECRNIFFGF